MAAAIAPPSYISNQISLPDPRFYGLSLNGYRYGMARERDTGSEKEREKERQTDRQTDRQRERSE